MAPGHKVRENALKQHPVKRQSSRKTTSTRPIDHIGRISKAVAKKSKKHVASAGVQSVRSSGRALRSSADLSISSSSANTNKSSEVSFTPNMDFRVCSLSQAQAHEIRNACRAIRQAHSKADCSALEEAQEADFVDEKSVLEDDKIIANLKAPEEAAPSKDLDDERLQFFRRICILYDGDPDNTKMEVICALLDTGSYYTLIFASKMEELEINWTRFRRDERLPLVSVQNKEFHAVGSREIVFMYKGMSTRHSVTAFVLEDPENGKSISFDILLGREHLVKSKAIMANHGVIGRYHAVSQRLPYCSQP